MSKISKLIFLKSFENSNLSDLKLKCGIEIHQQLNTNKLFCSCPCIIKPNNELNKEISRKLRFSFSETGEIDRAAVEEFKKDKLNLYHYNDKIACLVDLDEEPPGKINKKALSTAIRISQMLNLSFFDKIQFMRKLIIDGSIITGFQRTAILGINGELKTKKGNIIKIEGINLEEDSSRILERGDSYNIYSLDRQGIPLIEVTTGPQIKTPLEAFEVAFQIGNILRSFKETKRGLGTIRQDLNVSIAGGTRIEIKGTQNLKLIPEIIINEMKRQKIHLSIIEELKNRKINFENFTDKKLIDITDIFKKTSSKIILENLKCENSKVLVLKLNEFKNILGHEMQDNYRFATEISDKNKILFPKIKGLFHSDELPNYGITEIELNQINLKLKLNENDGFIILAGPETEIKKSFTNIIEIIKELIISIPSEVRNVDPKGTLTKFSRPMPSSARMYPETDVPIFELEKSYLNTESKKIPELYFDKLERLNNELNIEIPRLEELIEIYDELEIKELIKLSNKNAKFVYNILFEIPKDIKKREKLEIFDFKYSLLKDLFNFSGKNKLNQKIIRDLFISLYKDKKNEVENLQEYLNKNKLILESIDEKEIEKEIIKIIENNKGAPFGALMGKSMSFFNGKVDGKLISSILKKLL